MKLSVSTVEHWDGGACFFLVKVVFVLILFL
jgi:hypothetical protein